MKDHDHFTVIILTWSPGRSFAINFSQDYYFTIISHDRFMIISQIHFRIIISSYAYSYALLYLLVHLMHAYAWSSGWSYGFSRSLLDCLRDIFWLCPVGSLYLGIVIFFDLIILFRSYIYLVLPSRWRPQWRNPKWRLRKQPAFRQM